MKKFLEKLISQESNQLIGIYYDETNFDSFMVGEIVHIYREYVVIKNYSPEGRNDGFSCFHVNNIYKIETDSLYLKQIDNIREEDKSEFFPRLNGEDFIKEFLQYTENKQKPVEIYLEWDEKLAGYAKVKEEYVVLEVCNDYGYKESTIAFLLENVISLSYNTIKLNSYLVKKE